LGSAPLGGALSFYAGTCHRPQAGDPIITAPDDGYWSPAFAGHDTAENARHSSDCAGGKLGAFVLPVVLGSAREAAAGPTVTTAELVLAGDPADFC